MRLKGFSFVEKKKSSRYLSHTLDTISYLNFLPLSIWASWRGFAAASTIGIGIGITMADPSEAREQNGYYQDADATAYHDHNDDEGKPSDAHTGNNDYDQYASYNGADDHFTPGASVAEGLGEDEDYYQQCLRTLSEQSNSQDALYNEPSGAAQVDQYQNDQYDDQHTGYYDESGESGGEYNGPDGEVGQTAAYDESQYGQGEPYDESSQPYYDNRQEGAPQQDEYNDQNGEQVYDYDGYDQGDQVYEDGADYDQQYDDYPPEEGGGYADGEHGGYDDYAAGEQMTIPDILLLSFYCMNAKSPTDQTVEAKAVADASWNPVREYLSDHTLDDVGAAMLERGENEMTALHYACRNAPPSDIINIMLSASIDTCQWEDGK